MALAGGGGGSIFHRQLSSILWLISGGFASCVACLWIPVQHFLFPQRELILVLGVWVVWPGGRGAPPDEPPPPPPPWSPPPPWLRKALLTSLAPAICDLVQQADHSKERAQDTGCAARYPASLCSTRQALHPRSFSLRPKPTCRIPSKGAGELGLPLMGRGGGTRPRYQISISTRPRYQRYGGGIDRTTQQLL